MQREALTDDRSGWGRHRMDCSVRGRQGGQYESRPPADIRVFHQSVCGTKAVPQCLHFRASLRTNSRHSGHRTCVSGVAASAPAVGGILANALAGVPKRSSKKPPIKGLKKSEMRNQPNPLLPLLLAAKPTMTAKMNQKMAISMPRFPSGPRCYPDATPGGPVLP